MRKYCVIPIINHSLLKNDIFRNQDQFANDSLAIERAKFMACVIWSECFDQFSKYQKLLPIGYRRRRKSKSPVFHISCFFRLNSDIKSLSYRDRALSLALYYIQWNARPTESGDKILIHFINQSEDWFLFTHWGTFNYLPISLREHFKRIYLRCCSLRISYLEACDTLYSSLCLNTFHSISSCFYSKEEMDRSPQLATLSECVRPKGS